MIYESSLKVYNLKRCNKTISDLRYNVISTVEETQVYVVMGKQRILDGKKENEGNWAGGRGGEGGVLCQE